MVNPNFNAKTTRTEYAETGAVVLRDFFNGEFIELIRERFGTLVSSPTDKYQSGFSRVGYDLFEDLDVLRPLLKNEHFRMHMYELHREELIFTQALGFELVANINKGFPWHIGTQSFGYQRAEDFGCTIWIPLIPIDPQKQGGGMQYVKRSDVSGNFMYRDVDPRVFEILEKREQTNESVTVEEYVAFRDGPLNDPGMKSILDTFAVEPKLDLGDAILFDKNVIHASVPMKPGVHSTRQALAIRFISPESRFDEKRANRLEIPRRMLDFKGPTRFHLELGLADGELLRLSPRLASTLADRNLLCVDAA